MKAIFPLSLFFICNFMSYGQNSTFTVEYNGVSPKLPSPHRENYNGNIGIKNPERGFTIHGGSFELFSNSNFPNQSYLSTLNNENNVNVIPIEKYIQKFDEDGISLVELEAYVHYSDDLNNANADLNESHLNQAAKEIPEVLGKLGVKSHFILNSSLEYSSNSTNGVSNELAVDGVRFKKNINYFEQATPLFKSLNPYVAVAHLGWVNAPWDFNAYRLSGHWKKTNYLIGQEYPVGNFETENLLNNFHGTSQNSVQRSSWGQPHSKASAWEFQSDINQLRKQILDKTLDAFSDKKIILKSTFAIANYIGTSIKSSGPAYAVTYPVNLVDLVMSANHFTGQGKVGSLISNLQDKDQFLRIGVYDHAFGGDTYSHLWSIGDAHTQYIQWTPELPGNLGVDWANNAFHTDVYNLRKYRGNLWMHGELPVYETEDTLDNKLQNNNAWSTSSFNRNHQYFSNWYEGTDGIPNHQYDYEIGEGISSGRLQDGFYSALKMRYFNFTSFGIQHNNLLDGRSPYEMPDGFDYSLENNVENFVGSGIPRMENTAISGWKTKELSKEELQMFGMPISNQYFEDENGLSIKRNAYDYIRDHLGYRLELQKTTFTQTANQISLNTQIINRGFSAPQNKRTIYMVVLDENNDLIDFKALDNDWRTWQPDKFSNGIENEDYKENGVTSQNLNELKVGGIPLGEHRSNWHHEPITGYSPNTYSLNTNFNLKNVDDGLYKIGVFMPDSDPELEKNVAYNVKFSNQATYIPCMGVTILGCFTKGEIAENDNDFDGVSNNEDEHPNLPEHTEFTQALLKSTENCVNIMSRINSGVTVNTPVNTDLVKLLPNPVVNFVSISCEEPWETGKIVSLDGNVLTTFNKNEQPLDVSELSSGIYFIRLHSNEKLLVQRFIKQ